MHITHQSRPPSADQDLVTGSHGSGLALLHPGADEGPNIHQARFHSLSGLSTLQSLVCDLDAAGHRQLTGAAARSPFPNSRHLYPRATASRQKSVIARQRIPSPDCVCLEIESVVVRIAPSHAAWRRRDLGPALASIPFAVSRDLPACRCDENEGVGVSRPDALIAPSTRDDPGSVDAGPSVIRRGCDWARRRTSILRPIPPS
ncbi:hypothetical protein QBC39DRAFT_46316 [Podospora conica]|nr:hypothetical protein QBC39DRAFT_46316 [Schizothecium conicum]